MQYVTRTLSLLLLAVPALGCVAPAGESSGAVCADVSTHFESCDLSMDALTCLEDPEGAEAYLDLSCAQLRLFESSADGDDALFSSTGASAQSFYAAEAAGWNTTATFGELQGGDMTCNVLREGALVASGIAVTAGVATATCVAYGGVAIVASGGAAAVGAVPLCAFAATGTAAATITASLLTGATILCESGAFEMVVNAVRQVADGVIEVVYRGTAYLLQCNAGVYLHNSAMKQYYCKVAPRSCTEQGLTCADLQYRISNGQFCIDARRGIQACWGPIGDAGHQTAVREARNAQDRCITRYVSQGCGG